MRPIDERKIESRPTQAELRRIVAGAAASGPRRGRGPRLKRRAAIVCGAAAAGIVAALATAVWTLGPDELWSGAGERAAALKVTLPFAARLRVAEADARLRADAPRLDEIHRAARVHAADPVGAARAALARGDARLVGVFAGWGMLFPAVPDAEGARVPRERGCRFSFILSDAGDQLLRDECSRYAAAYNAEILRRPAAPAPPGAQEDVPRDLSFIASPCRAETPADGLPPPKP